MSLSFYYEFAAPASIAAEELEEFLREVEQLARSLGFAPTMVLNVPFDTPERREFSRRLGGSFMVQDQRLKGVVLPSPGQLCDHDQIAGEGRMISEYGVVLVVTDERGGEACFGFFKFPKHVVDIHGAVVAETGLGGRWWFRDFVNSPDPRYREIVRRFELVGFAKRMKDEFA
jgi:hypothetical protein